MDSTQLDTLETEVLALILEYVEDTSPRTTQSVALTNKHLYSVAHLVRSRHLKFRFRRHSKPSDFSDKCESWASNKDTLASVRTLTIEGSLEQIGHSLNPAITTAQNALATFISKIGKLQMLNWNIGVPIPLTVLQALHEHQKYSCLRMFNFTAANTTAPNETARELAKSPALTHLRMVQGYSHTSPNTQELEFRYIVAQAPNLEYAGIIKRNFFLPYNVSQNANPPVAFTYKDINRSTFRNLTLDGYEMSKPTLDDWSRTVELSNLQNLKFSRGELKVSYFQHAATMLPNLKHVSLNFRQVANLRGSMGNERANLLAAANQYLKTCAPLDTISLWSWRDVISVQELIHRHGSSLTSLQLHERETADANISRGCITAEEIDLIVDNCPKLTHLTIDLNRSKSAVKLDACDQNFACINALKRIRATLKHLVIYFDLGMAHIVSDSRYTYTESESELSSDDDDNTNEDNDGENGIRMPATKRARFSNKLIAPTADDVMETYIREIWSVLFGSSKTGAMDIKVGEWESMRALDRPPSFSDTVQHSEYFRTRHFIVRPAERDDDDDCIMKRLTVESQNSWWLSNRPADGVET